MAVSAARIETTDGRLLGHLFDLRTRWAPGQSHPLVVHALVYGRRGWMERVGLRPRRLQTLPWSAVRRIEPGLIVVDLDATTHD